jgi:hypothetical protein
VSCPGSRRLALNPGTSIPVHIKNTDRAMVVLNAKKLRAFVYIHGSVARARSDQSE